MVLSWWVAPTGAFLHRCRSARAPICRRREVRQVIPTALASKGPVGYVATGLKPGGGFESHCCTSNRRHPRYSTAACYSIRIADLMQSHLRATLRRLPLDRLPGMTVCHGQIALNCSTLPNGRRHQTWSQQNRTTQNIFLCAGSGCKGRRENVPRGRLDRRVSAVVVQDKCPPKRSAEMSPVYWGIVSDVDAGRVAGDRRVGGVSVSM